jgi:hypothetical protein
LRGQVQNVFSKTNPENDRCGGIFGTFLGDFLDFLDDKSVNAPRFVGDGVNPK